MGKGQEDGGEEEDGWEGNALLPRSAQRRQRVPLGPHLLLASDLGGGGTTIASEPRSRGAPGECRPAAGRPAAAGGLASSSWCHFDVVQVPRPGNPCSALISSRPDSSTGSVLQGAGAGHACQLCRATERDSPRCHSAFASIHKPSRG